MALLEGMLDGITGAGLFARLNWPGAPTEFVDSRTPDEFDAEQAAVTFKGSLQAIKSKAPTASATPISAASRHT